MINKVILLSFIVVSSLKAQVTAVQYCPGLIKQNNNYCTCYMIIDPISGDTVDNRIDLFNIWIDTIWIYKLDSVLLFKNRQDTVFSCAINSNGNLHGSAEFLYGTPSMYSRVDFWDGKKNGEMFLRYGDAVDVSNYQQGVLHGPFSGYYRSKIIHSGHYVNGLLEGNYFEYYPKGELKTVLKFKQGRFVPGMYYEYFPNGNTASTIKVKRTLKKPQVTRFKDI